MIFITMMMPSLPGITLRRSSPESYRGRTVSIQIDDESDGATTSTNMEENHYRLVKEDSLSPSSLPQPPLPFTTSSTGNIWNYSNDFMTTDECSSVLPSQASPHRTPAITEENTSSKRKPRLRAAVEHIVYHPIVRFFTCVGGGGGGSSHTRSSLRTKAPTAILQTMKQFPYQGRLQKLGCSTLKDLAMDSWALKVSVVEAGAIPVVLKAMRLHSTDASLNLIACRLLYEIVNVPPLVVEDDRSIIIALIQTMGHHGDDEDVLVAALEILMAMTDPQCGEHDGEEGNGGALESLRHQLGGVVLAKLEHGFRGRNTAISSTAEILLKRLYF